MRMPGTYKIYSAATHSSWSAVVEGWRLGNAGLWERRPDREAVWSAVIACPGFVI
jgi:hypothetical protein